MPVIYSAMTKMKPKTTFCDIAKTWQRKDLLQSKKKSRVHNYETELLWRMIRKAVSNNLFWEKENHKGFEKFPPKKKTCMTIRILI